MSDRVGRITRRADFLRIARSSRRWVTPGLIVQTDRAPTDQVRVGFTVTRKVGKAVVRNRIRRRLRSVATAMLDQHAMPGQDFVVIGRAATLERPYPSLHDDLMSALKGLRVWTDAPETP